MPTKKWTKQHRIAFIKTMRTKRKERLAQKNMGERVVRRLPKVKANVLRRSVSHAGGAQPKTINVYEDGLLVQYDLRPVQAYVRSTRA